MSRHSSAGVVDASVCKAMRPLIYKFSDMNIKQLLGANQNTLIIVSADDLKEFASSLIEEAQKLKPEQKDEQMYSPRAFANRHGVTTSTLWRWCKSGLLTPVRVGGRVYYRDCDLKIVEG